MSNKHLLTVTYTADDIDRRAAVGAFSGTSFSPEVRADQVIADYVKHMDQLVETFGQWATADNAAEMSKDLETYRAGYVKHCLTWLHSYANVVSTMIAGPSGFNTRQMQKRGRWADNHRQRWIDYGAKARTRLHRKYDPSRMDYAIRSDDADAIEKLEEKIAQLERNQETMKEANKIIRAKNASDEDKIGDLVSLGFSEKNARKLMEPDFAGRLGFASYALTNNNANIKRNRDRLAQLQREAQRAPVDDREVMAGLTVSENTDEVRLQVFFDGKPPAAVRSIMKSNGFRWAPSQGAWQRLLNDNARYAWKRIEPQVVEALNA
jgi:hypothetical protein